MPDNEIQNGEKTDEQALPSDSDSPETITLSTTKTMGRFSKNTIIAALVGLGITGYIIHFLTHKNLQGSSILYIGVPLILSYVFLNAAPTKSALGAIMKGLTIFMLLTGPILQEGFICIVMAAPLFYIVGGIVGWAIDHSRKRKQSKLLASPMIIMLALLSFEGTHPNLTFDRNHTVKVEKLVAANAASVEQQLQQPITFGADVPIFLKIFPFPTSTAFNGTQLGDENTLHFVYYKHFYFNPKIGDLTYKVSSRSANHIESFVLSDDSYVNTYLNWTRSKVSWQAIDDKHTKVVWEIDYKRKLDPAWYFGTLQHYAVNMMANSLIKYAATPEDSRE